jgi:Phosphotransferase system mannitol/fructose-specific IIA domain (Ntr-type)
MEPIDFIKNGIILTNLKASSKEEVFKILYDKLYKSGNVKESFYNGLVEREKKFPTGILLKSYNIAIPHTDPEHVINPSIAIATLEEPIIFQCMDDENKSVSVKMVFILALKESHSHIEILQKIILMIQNDLLLEKLLKSQNKEEFVQQISENQ